MTWAYARRREPELMDQPGLDPGLHRQALTGLACVNALSRSAAVLWPEISELARRLSRPIRVLDVASGGGDIALSLARRAARGGIPLEFDGCDISPLAVGYAEERARQAGLKNARFVQLDALQSSWPGEYDAVMCSLFLHHLSDRDAERLLQKMAETARHLVLVNDLRRSRAAYALAWLGCRILSRSPVVHTDGPRSVAAAFTVGELRELATRSGLAGATVARRWPQRMLLVWKRP
jgi:2-polyprenyl-3-methyl-5-hydroxy-6-metoxy-1,4-benzoquinol methylase